MKQLIYASRATSVFSPDALRTLLAKARERNTAAAVSGMLLHVDGAFLQVLEGDGVVVQKVFDKIGTDTRHAHVLLLSVHDVEVRNFPDWSMGFFDATGRASTMLGYRAGNGFADLAGDPKAIVRIVDDFRSGRWRSLAA